MERRVDPAVWSWVFGFAGRVNQAKDGEGMIIDERKPSPSFTQCPAQVLIAFGGPWGGFFEHWDPVEGCES